MYEVLKMISVSFPIYSIKNETAPSFTPSFIFPLNVSSITTLNFEENFLGFKYLAVISTLLSVLTFSFT